VSRHFKEWFENQKIVVDGQEYEGCTFVECELIYCGGEPPSLSNDEFVRCTWHLADAALRTLGFFAVLNMSGMRELVEAWISMALRTRVLPKAPEDPIQ
jgi:hypothetical protein